MSDEAGNRRDRILATRRDSVRGDTEGSEGKKSRGGRIFMGHERPNGPRGSGVRAFNSEAGPRGATGIPGDS